MNDALDIEKALPVVRRLVTSVITRKDIMKDDNWSAVIRVSVCNVADM